MSAEQDIPEKCRECTWPMRHHIFSHYCIQELREHGVCAKPPDCPFCKTELVDDTIQIRHYKCQKCGWGGYYTDLPEGDYVLLREVAHHILETQTQQAYYYLLGLAGCPNLGMGLRYIDSYDYHSVRIHLDDVQEFVKRIREWREASV